MKLLAVFVALALVLFAGYAAVKVAGRLRRLAGVRRLPEAAVLRAARGADLTVTLFRTRPFLGMRPGRPHPAHGDLLLTADRLLLATDRGVLADLRVAGPSRLASARCTGPGRLVLEGQVPHPSGPAGLYRIELVVDDAPAWVEALGPFADAVVAWQPGRAPPGRPQVS